MLQSWCQSPMFSVFTCLKLRWSNCAKITTSLVKKIDAELQANLIMDIKIKIDSKWLCNWGVINCL